MTKPTFDTIEICRSLIQKAIRRADLEITRRAVGFLFHAGDFQWVRNRLAILTFEECWTYGFQVSYENDKRIILDHLLRLSGTVKNRNAAGLGSLSYIFSGGDESVLDISESDSQIKFIAKAISNPPEFWEWARRQHSDDTEKKLMESAHKAFGQAEQPWDKAFTLAAAYLALTDGIPETKLVRDPSTGDFPLWIALDMHTRIGTAVIREAAWQINFDPDKALWLTFYLEGARCHEITLSPWWEREKAWRMKSLGLNMDEANGAWERLKPVLIELLEDETDKMRREIFGIGLI